MLHFYLIFFKNGSARTKLQYSRIIFIDRKFVYKFINDQFTIDTIGVLLQLEAIYKDVNFKL